MLLQNDGGEERRFQTVRASVADHASEAAERGTAVRFLVVGQPIQVTLHLEGCTEPVDEPTLASGKGHAVSRRRP